MLNASIFLAVRHGWCALEQALKPNSRTISRKRRRSAPLASSLSLPWCSLRGDGIDQCSDAGDVNLDHVAGTHPKRWLAGEAHAFGSAGGDHIARAKRSHGADIGDKRRDIEDEVR